MKKEIKWLLKDKYNFSEDDVKNFQICTASLNIAKDIERINNGEPINYVIGWQEFLDCKIDLQFKPLIPRVETEFWVNQAISSIQKDKEIEVLDLCCGSGCIGIAILKHIPFSKVTFVDVSENAIKQTKFNLKLNEISSDRYTVIKSDMFEMLLGNFDYIFANPPYVDKQSLVPESLKYEPEIAIFAEKNGLMYIENILSNFQKYLTKDGQLYMEFGYKQEAEIKGFLDKLSLNNYFIEKDQYDIDRILHYRLS